MFLECLGSGPFLNNCSGCIPVEVSKIATLAYNSIRIIVPLVLVIIGMFDMAKAITSQKEDDIKKAQQLLVKKAVAGALVFFLFSLVTWMLTILGSTSGNAQGEENVISCLNELFNYNKDNNNYKEGAAQGSTDIANQCRNYGYSTYLKIYDDSGNYFNVCATKANSSDVDCGTDNAEKYILNDSETHCVYKLDNTNRYTLDEKASNYLNNVKEKLNKCPNKTSYSDCTECCNQQGYSSIFTTDSKCTCVKRR